ncbi:MAG: hypothetical protein JRJ86_14545 [Deltaproteobacteria bacterium]|nr:hypothetical protein [Deltaproteobacteria bacterium]MBW2049893.1 hypothetical protein [Deltaproteobacteria bacterium]MBW2112232.1 hypothetical protein [Deltaproteobacteria bacterium]
MEQDQEVREPEQVGVWVKVVVAGAKVEVKGVVLEQDLAVTACVPTVVKEPPIN